ncbi:scopoletin glucosyltransferase-like [Abrus precatorius]|uniref:Scopoletin glucosyltransferase-like n=1 Tax=Abrus precatorius TaxID=3816 RepID=A0A8B8M418_ABRPR|nr:scopoletin glucosyltransferase-like [Abrus precatorius]
MPSLIQFRSFLSNDFFKNQSRIQSRVLENLHCQHADARAYEFCLHPHASHFLSLHKSSPLPNSFSILKGRTYLLKAANTVSNSGVRNMDGQLHILFLPFPGLGHMIPMSDMAKVFRARGVRATIVTTPMNEATICGSTRKGVDSESESEIEIRTIKFPCAEAGLPEGCENTESIPSPAMVPAFFKATTMLQTPFEHLLLHLQPPPHCIITSAFFPWATHSAAKLNIPRLVFYGTGAFPLCASECVRLYQPQKNVSSDSEPFVIPHLPGQIKMTRMALPDYAKTDDPDSDFARLVEAIKESVATSLGVVFNSFYELEQVYADYYRDILGREAWFIGPLSLCNEEKDKGKRGKEASIDQVEILKWLDSKKPNSVVYVCFGSIANFSESQLREIAIGLEASGQHFIWVVRRSDKEWIPEGFERRMEGRGMIIRGWAPQVLILEHEAVGGFVTHCGWNSTLEGVAAGVAMVTWPVSAEQFYNEKFVTELLQTGVPVGAQKWARFVGDSISSHALEKAVIRIMVGEEAEGMRIRAHKLARMARIAVQPNGSSYFHLTALIQHLRSCSVPFPST